jgi:hypothetical protein
VTAEEANAAWPAWVKAVLVEKLKGIKNFRAAHDMVMEGFPDTEIARQIQAMGDLTDLSHRYVTNVVKHYKHSIPKHEIVARLLPSRTITLTPEEKPVMLKAIASQLDTIDRIITIAEKLGMTEESERRSERSRSVDWDSVYSRPGMNELMQDPKSRYRIVKFVEAMAGMYGKMSPERQSQMMETAVKKFRREYSPDDNAPQEDIVVVERDAPDLLRPPRRVISEEVVEVQAKVPFYTSRPPG